MLMLDLNMTMEALDLAIDDDVFSTRTSRAVTFTLSSSASSTSLHSQEDNKPGEPKTFELFTKPRLESRQLTHSQSVTLECQRRRPTIQDPYQIAPDLEMLDDWMKVSLFLYD